MNKDYIVLGAMFSVVVGVIIWHTLYGAPAVAQSLGTNPGPDTTPGNQSLGPDYLTYNNTPYGFGPPVNNFVMPSSTAGLNGIKQSSCGGCGGARQGGRF